MEASFGHDFSSVRVHSDDAAAASAAAVDAVAYTVGRHVAFARGSYAPGTPAGDQLLAHELAHVVQQTAARPSSVPAVQVAAADAAGEREAMAAASVLPAGVMPALTLRPIMLARQSASSSPGTSTAAQSRGAVPRMDTGGKPAPQVSQVSRDLTADFLHALSDKVASLRLPQRLRYVRALLGHQAMLYAMVSLVRPEGTVTLSADEKPNAMHAFEAAVAIFVPQQAKAIEQELMRGTAEGPAQWGEVLKEFEGASEGLNLAPYAGMKDRVEDALLKRAAAKTEGGKLPPGHERAVPTLRGEYRELRHQMVEAYLAGIDTWQIPEEASFNVAALESGEGAVASAAGSIMTALPGMEVLGMEATAGVGLAVGSLGIGLIAIGAAAAIIAVWKQAKEAREEERRKIIEAGVKRELINGVTETFDRLREHEDFILSELVIEASREKISLDSAQGVWTAFVWKQVAPDFPTSLGKGKKWVADKMKKEFDAALKKK
jgi:hypothetical protein